MAQAHPRLAYAHFPTGRTAQWFGYLHRDGTVSTTIRAKCGKARSISHACSSIAGSCVRRCSQGNDADAAGSNELLIYKCDNWERTAR